MARRVSSPSIVGRVAELEALRDGLAAAAEGAPRVVLVAGESGVGKSRLLAEFVAGASADGVLVLEGDCIELGDGELPYAPIVGALRDIARVVEPSILAELPEPGRQELGRLLPALTAAAAPAVAASPPVLFEAVLGLFARLAKESPVLLAIEDIHWADRSTRDLLAFLARSLRSDRLLIIATYRIDELHRRHPLRGLLAELARLPRIDRLDLGRLSHDEVAEQLAGILGSVPSADLVRRIHRRSEGNPFFAEELLAADADGALPDTLRDALLLRIEALPEASRHLLRFLAAAGRPVLGGLLGAAAGATDDVVSAAMREAVGQHVVSVSKDQRFRFRHALFGEALYDDLLPGERSEVHRALAQALAGVPGFAPESESIAAAELAHHWQAAHVLPEALAASTAAGAAARAAGAYAEAARHFDAALKLWDQVPDAPLRAGVSRAAILRDAGEAAHLAGDYEEGTVYLAEAADAFLDEQDHTAAALVQVRLGRCFWAAGRSDDAIAAHARAVALMPLEATAERAQVLAMMARVLMVSDRLAQSLPIAEQALAIARAVDAREAEGHALNTIGIDVAELGDRERGIAILRVALAIAQELGFPDELGSSYVNISDQIDQAGRIEEAAELAIEGMRATERAGAVRLHGAFLAAEAASRLIRLGRYQDAERLVAEALTRNAGGRTEAALHQRRAQILIERGHPAAAEHALDLARRTIDFTISRGSGRRAPARWRPRSGSANPTAQRRSPSTFSGVSARAFRQPGCRAVRPRAPRRGRLASSGAGTCASSRPSPTACTCEPDLRA